MFNKARKIFFLNGGSKQFGNDFREACVKNKIECFSARAHHNSFLLLDNSGPRYFHLGEEINLKDFNYAFIRVKTRFSHMTALISYLLTSYKIPFNDVGNIEHTKNDEKITQMVKFSRHHIPIPKTVIFSRISYKKNLEKISAFISYPCVLKTNGSKGDAVWKINDKSELEAKMSLITEELMLVQELIPNKYDIRALIFDGVLLGAIERYAKNSFYNNAAKGAVLKPAKVSRSEFKLSLKAMKVLELNFGGIDYIRTEKGIVFFEINKGPQVYGLQATLHVNIPEKIVKEINKKFKNFTSKILRK